MSINTFGDHILSGEDAIQALSLYIEQLEGERNTNEENSHIEARIKMAKALTQAIRNLQTEK